MSRIIATEYVSLDGMMDDPGQWSFPFFHPEVGQYKFDELFASDAMLLGRVTHEAFAAAWTTMSDEAGFADRMNGMPKYVASRTRTEVGWNGTVLQGELGDAVAALKAEGDQTLLLAGSGQVVRELLSRGLVDELRLLVHPIVLGGSMPLFAGLDRMTLTLTETKTFATGVVPMHYSR